MSGSDWIDDMFARGLLSPSQVESIRKVVPSASSATSMTGELSPGLSTPASFARPLILSCSPCGKAYTFDGGDTSAVRNCPECSLPMKSLEVETLFGERAAGHSLTSERRFGRYILRRELGRGGMGIVYEAHDTAMNRRVALKMLESAGKELIPESVERLKREARAAGKLKHPSIVAIYDVDAVDGRHFFTMDFVEGESLDVVLKRDDAMKELPLRRRVEVLADVAEALQCAHAQGVIHRDVKPSNVMIALSGRGMLLDFGLARDTAGDGSAVLTRANAIVGTPEFMSPEQASGSARTTGPSADVFSFGSLLYTALTGDMPFRGSNAQVLYAIVNSRPAPPARINRLVPPDLETICLRCLEKDPSQRFPDGALLAAELRRFLDGKPIESHPASWLTRVFRRLSRQSTLPPAPTADLRRFEEEHIAVVARARAQKEALALFEQARPVLDSAWRYLYDREASHEELVRRLEVGQKLIEEGLAKSPETALGHYLLGRAWEIKGWEENAERCWREALRIDPDFAAVRFHLGRLLVERAFMESMGSTDEVRTARAPVAQRIVAEARTELDKALAHGSGLEDELEGRVVEAMEAFLAGKLESAAELCRLGVAAFPVAHGREDFWWVLGNCLVGEAQEKAYDEAIRIRPRHALALFSRARSRSRRDDHAGSLADYADALRIKPRFKWALSNRAFALMVLNRNEEALKDVEEVLKLDADCVPALVNRGGLRAGVADEAGAIADFRRAIALDPRMPISRNALIIALVGFKRWEEALEATDEALKARPDVWYFWSNRGEILRELKRWVEAASSYDRAVELEAGAWSVYLNRARARFELKDCRGADADLINCFKLMPAGCSEEASARELQARVEESLKGLAGGK